MPVNTIIRRFAREIAKGIELVGTPVEVYQPSVTVLADRNIVPNAYTLVTNDMKALIAPDENVRDRATALGIYAAKVGLAYIKDTQVSLVGDRYILREIASGQAWVIHGEPIVPSDPAAVGAECLISVVKVKPDGIP